MCGTLPLSIESNLTIQGHPGFTATQKFRFLDFQKYGKRFLISQGKGDLYMSPVLLHFVIPDVITQIPWTHLVLPKNAKQKVCHRWDSQCYIYLARSARIKTYVPFLPDHWKPASDYNGIDTCTYKPLVFKPDLHFFFANKHALHYDS